MGRIIKEIGRHYQVDTEIPDTVDELRQEFASCLADVPSGNRLILILDGLDKLEDKDNARDLGWLPISLPPNLRLIVSAAPGRTLDALSLRKTWSSLELRGMDAPERIDLVEEYLGRYGKRLTEAQVQEITAANQTELPLYLRAMLEETEAIRRIRQTRRKDILLS